jgi:hypothetical protein
MHRLPSNSAVRRIRITSLLMLGKCLLTFAAVGVLACAITINDRNLVQIGCGLLSLAALMVLLQWIISARANCPLCMTPVLGNKKCSKHRTSTSTLGSHRLRVALEVLFLNRFRCPYCGELCEVKVRSHNPR